MSRVLITGGRGLVGRPTVAALLAAGHQVVSVTRSPRVGAPDVALTEVSVGDLGATNDWTRLLRGVDAVVHLAGRRPHADDEGTDAIASFYQVNVQGSARLAAAARAAGVSRFLHVSTLKVHGETSDGPLTELSPTRPESPYASSKLEGEEAVRDALKGSPVALTILRPPMIYGPGVEGHFERLLMLAARGIPWPLGAQDNRRSMVAASNLADLLAHLVTQAPEQEALLVAEGPPLSSAELFRLLQRGFGRREWSLPFDLSPLLRTARFSPVDGLLERLLGSLEVDADRLFEATGWAPPASTEDALAATARWYAAR